MRICQFYIVLSRVATTDSLNLLLGFVLPLILRWIPVFGISRFRGYAGITYSLMGSSALLCPIVTHPYLHHHSFLCSLGCFQVKP